MKVLIVCAVLLPAVAQTPIARIPMHLATVNVVASDAGGPVRNLRAADFLVVANGTRQKLEILAVHTAGRPAQPAPALASNTLTNRIEYRDRSSAGATVILLDGLNTQFRKTAAARAQLTGWLPALDPGSTLCILLPDGRLVHSASDRSAALDRLLGPAAPADLSHDQRANRTAVAIASIANHLLRVPGRKSLIWLSASFPLSLWERSAGGMDSVARAINDANLAVYAVDAGPLGGTARPGANACDPAALAAHTGGRAFLGGKEVQSALANVASDSQTSYTLGFYPDPAWLGPQFHPLQVEVTRPGIRLLYRDRFLAIADHPVPALTRFQVDDELSSPLDSTGISITARLGTSVDNSLKALVPGNELALRPSPQGWSGQLDIFCESRSQTGATLGMSAEQLTLTLTNDQYRKLLDAGITHRLALNPGAASARLLIHDRTSGRVGSLTIPVPSPSAPTFRSETELVLVPFHIVPRRGALIADLRPDEIALREDGIAQRIAHFSGGRLHPSKMPLEIGLLFDCSSSVSDAGSLDPFVFHSSLLNEYEHASIGIYAFSKTYYRLTQPTRDPAALQAAMRGVFTVPNTNTALFESITAAIQDLGEKAGAPRRMLIIFSDGVSNSDHDDRMYATASTAANRLNMALYPVLLSGTGTVNTPGRTQSGAAGRSMPTFRLDPATSIDYFKSLGGQTGGRLLMHSANDSGVVATVLQSIATQIRYEYVAGYYPTRPPDGKMHHVEVVLKSRERGRIEGGKRSLSRNFRE